MDLRKRIVVFLLSAVFAATAACPAGYPVFDIDGWLASLDQLYQTYDMVENTITQIENQYKQIQHAIEVAKGIDWENIKFDGDFDIRNDIKNATKRVNRLLNQARNIKSAITTPSINCGNVKYSIADLCGATKPENGLWEGRKNMLTAIGDYKNYISDNMKQALTNLTEGLSDKEKKAIWRKYGISPQNYMMVNTAHTEVMNAANNILGNVAETVKNDRLEARAELNSALIEACSQSVDSDGNVSQNSFLETIMHLMNNLDLGVAELQDSIYESGAMAASKVIADDARANAETDELRKQTEMHDTKNSRLSSRTRR